MKRIIVSINGINDVYKFVQKAQLIEGDVTVFRDKYAVDGKSVLGVFSVDMSQNVTVEYPNNATDFENFIKTFEVK